MSLDRTQHQSTDELRKARELSLEPTRPPAQVPGYKLQKFLGSGAYGEVWLAVDLKTGRRVAIKFYSRRSASDVEQLAREVEKLVVLAADRYVVQLLDVGWTANPPFYVMDYIEHGSLEDRLNGPAGISPEDAIELFKELANGLMHLHDKGILHCDLKPGNVLLDQDGKPRVADFGQSRLSTENTSALGTLFYMAPEQADLNAAPDAGWDVYGLGALLFSMLTGKPPYYSLQLANRIESTEDISQRLVVYRDGLFAAPKPTEHRAIAGVDRGLAEIIDRCIAADAHKRFPNIQSLLLALHQREITRARRPLMMLGLLGPLLLISVMSLFGWWAFRQAVDRTQEEITKKAIESNVFAAQLAARSAAEQIDEYFRVVGQLSRDAEFKKVFAEVVSDPALLELRTAIADPAKNAKGTEEVDPQIGQLRQQFRNHGLRKKLQPFLEKRLLDKSGDFPVAASWFVSDRFGNQIASAFRRENRTLGNNYSYRTYFTGLNRDLKTADKETPSFDVAVEPAARQIIERPHLSAVFISEQSNTWKVAFSAPIFRDGKVDGIVAVTVDLGSFIDFANTATHYAMLVDTRSVDLASSNHRGIILEHPLFQTVLQEERRIPDELARCRLNLDSLVEGTQFRDPVGQTKIGKATNYDQLSIVAPASVTKQETPAPDKTGAAADNQRSDTGLIVLAVEDRASIEAPANDLSHQLGRLAAFASLMLLLVSIGMWFFVKRMLQESRQRLDRAFSPAAESTAGNQLETIAAGDNPLTPPAESESSA